MVVNAETERVIRRILGDMLPKLNELQKRQLQGSIADALGHGGVAYVKSLTGAARNTISRGIEDLNSAPETESGAQSSTMPRIRKPGGGRKKEAEKHPKLYQDIEEIIAPDTYGNPMKPLRWTTLSLRKIAEELQKKGYKVSQNIVSRALETLGYSKQQNQKMYQVGNQHPDRDAQFQHINETAQAYLDQGDPVISIDTKKKENVGNFKNPGSEYRKEKSPRKVLDHDFPISELGKVNPYGVYVLNDNTGFVNLGTSHDTAEFAGESVYRWWEAVGKNTFPEAKRLYINCDGGGSNSSRKWLWKYQLQLLANKTGLEIEVSHFPPGTSKWNKIEHRLFCYISKNWQGQPLIDIETIVSLIGSTTTKKGLKVICQVDNNVYETGKKISEEEKASINIELLEPLSQWNYIIRPIEK